MKKLMGITLISIVMAHTEASALVINEAWTNMSDPQIMSYFFTTKLNLLPLHGKVRSKTKYWSGDYWALNQGNINFRWFAKRKIGFNLNSPDKATAQRMTVPQLAELSPSEKYDLYIGRYDYPLKKEVQGIADPRAQGWEGICHGWSPASMNHEEPTPKLLKNPDGIEIPFGSSDIKALLSYYYAYGFEVPTTYQMGRRCFSGPFLNNDKDCNEDLNAGAFHIVLGNRIGIEGIGFIADLQRYQEVWNHPVTQYNSKIVRELLPKRNSAPGTTTVYQVKTTITYLTENGNDWHPVLGTPKQTNDTYSYEYSLDIDQSGNIIGGDWISRARPDFLWLKDRPISFEGSLSQLSDLLNDE